MNFYSLDFILFPWIEAIFKLLLRYVNVQEADIEEWQKDVFRDTGTQWVMGFGAMNSSPKVCLAK